MRGNRAGRTGDRRRSVPRECVGLPEVLPETPCCSGDARAAARRGLVQGPDAGAPPRKTLDFRAATNSRRRRRSSVSMEKEWSVSHPRIGSLWRNSAYTRTPPGRSTRSISESARGVLGEVMVGGAGMMDHVEREHDIERMGGVRQREHVRRPEGERRGRMARVPLPNGTTCLLDLMRVEVGGDVLGGVKSLDESHRQGTVSAADLETTSSRRDPDLPPDPVVRSSRSPRRREIHEKSRDEVHLGHEPTVETGSTDSGF